MSKTKELINAIKEGKEKAEVFEAYSKVAISVLSAKIEEKRKEIAAKLFNKKDAS